MDRTKEWFREKLSDRGGEWDRGSAERRHRDDLGVGAAGAGMLGAPLSREMHTPGYTAPTSTSALSGSYEGRGPRSYRRSDERVLEEACERLTRNPDVDASDITVRVENGIVTLSGTVHDRYQKRAAEDAVCDLWGVSDVSNDLRITSTSATGSGVSSVTGTTRHS
jgi:hypothetical protein